MDEARNIEERRPGTGPAHPDGAQRAADRRGPDALEAGNAGNAGGAGTAAGAAPGAGGAAEGPDVAELHDRWQRAVAELDNMRKRFERQLEAARRAERDRVSAAWLPVLDHLELALQHAQADPASIIAGVEAVHRQVLGVLDALGYQRVDEVGARFDPSLHEAAQVVRDPHTEPNTVVAVLRPGYRGETALLRPAVVTVAGGGE